MAAQPTGTVTMLFTDIEASTRLLDRLGTERYGQALELHRRLLREAFERHDGYEVDCEGDAFHVAFGRAEDAVTAAAEAQQALAGAEWPDGHEIRVRMGVHTGEPLAMPPKYVGMDVHRAARIMAAGHGGQVLLSEVTQRLVPAVETISLGEHRLKDLLQPEPLYQLGIDGLPGEFPSLKTLENRPTNLPVLRDATIGRERELAEIASLLTTVEVRLLTLTGPGGTGKTRIALQAAAEVLDDFTNGVFFVPLAPVRDPRLVLRAVLQTLAVREVADEDVADTLANYVERKRMLLVLDNFEQVVDAAGGVSGLLARCPDLRILVTSRERLRIEGERVYAVPPLHLPDKGDDVAAIAGSEAVALFVARAKAAASISFAAERDLTTVAEVCTMLDGLPLAIELAAARVAVLPPAALLRRLDRRLHILTVGGRDADPRQQTLLATIEWSHSLLTPEEQQLFARLAIFVDGCRIDAAATVCAPMKDEIETLDVVSSLVEKNLVRQRTDPDGEPRYWMLQTIKEYAEERLATDPEADDVRRRHVDRVIGDVDALHPLIARGDHAAIELVQAEIGNVRAALRTAIDRGWATDALSLVGSLRNFWVLHLVEGLEWLAAALAIDASGDARPRAAALEAAAYLSILQGNVAECERRAEEALAVGRELDDLELVADAQRQLANALLVDDRVQEALSMYEASLASARQTGDERLQADALHGVGNAALKAGDYDRVVEVDGQVLALYRNLSDELGAVRASFNLGLAALGQGRYEQAWAFVIDALRPAVELQQRGAEGAWLDGIAYPLIAIAALLSETGEHLRAGRSLGAADVLLAQSGRTLTGPELRLYERTVSALRAALSEQGFTAAYAEGAESWQEAVSSVLADAELPAVVPS